jgi:hypothetical protein
MFIMMITLAFSSFIVEMMFAAKIPAWRRNAHKLKWLNMVISIGLSFVLGTAFGAKGITAMGAAMLATVLSIPGYAFLHWNYDSPQAIARGGDQLSHLKKISRQSYDKWSVALSDLFKLIYTFIRFLTFPIWFSRNVYIKVKPYIVKFNNWTDARRASRSTLL